MFVYVADEFQTLEGGKTLAVGLFTDRVVVINVPLSAPPPSTELPYGIPIGVLAVVMDLPAPALDAAVSINPPDGASLVPARNITVKGEVGGSANVHLRFDPFLMTAAGVYTVTFAFEGHEVLSDTFELRIKRIDDNRDPPMLVQRALKTPKVTE